MDNVPFRVLLGFLGFLAGFLAIAYVNGALFPPDGGIRILQLVTAGFGAWVLQSAPCPRQPPTP